MDDGTQAHRTGAAPPRVSRRAVLRATAALAGTSALGGASALAPAVAAAAAPGTVPIPPNARGPAIPDEGFLLQEIGDDLFWLTDGIYQMVFLRHRRGVVAVDAPPTLGNNILRAVRRVTRKPVTDLVYSHHHADHIGAASIFDDRRLRIYAHEETAELLEAVHDPNRPEPTRVFERSRRIRRGEHELRLDYHGPNHSEGNIFIWAPRQKVLTLIDVIFPGWVPFAYLAISTNIPGWIDAHHQVLQYPFETFVGGHLTRLGTRQDVETQQRYLADLRAEGEKALVDPAVLGAAFDPTKVDQANPWAVFEAYLAAAATRVSDVVAPRWTGTLGGADVFTDENAFTMNEAIRVDFGNLAPFGIRA